MIQKESKAEVEAGENQAILNRRGSLKDYALYLPGHLKSKPNLD